MTGGLLPPGAKIAPEAEQALERALSCLRAGLPVSAWRWAERARQELDRLTDGAEVATGEQGDSGELRQITA